MHKSPISKILLVAYSAFLYKIMVLRDIPVIHIGHMMFNFGGADANGEANFIPFKTIVPYLFGYKGLVIAGVNIVGNIVLLIPFGFLVAFIWRKLNWGKMFFIASVTCVFIEGMQVLLYTGIFDIDDVILNALGVMVGYWICGVFKKK